jgi:hypothetical protein
MTERVLGPTGSKRRLLRFLPMLAAVAAAVVLIPGGLAVHQEGIFELDKTPTVDANATNDPAVDGDDWDQVFAGTDNAVQSTFVTDPSDTDTDTHFTGGSTKDHNDLTQWNHTLKKPSPPKDDITDAYAAAYVDPDDDHLIVYFGMDRFANNGTSQIGFWFFQDEVSLNADGTFSGIHTEGDVLVLSDFTQGGAISTIRVLQWVDIPGACSPTPDPNCEDANLLRIGQGVDCSVTSVGDDVCASANRGVVDAPWPYSAKFPPPPPNEGDFPAGSFYEGGIDVTELIPDVSCFTSFLAESRSSASVDAVLKDFALGDFPTCEAEMNTVPVPDDEIGIGESISDQATVTGSGLNAPPPTGTVDFFVCGPLQAGELCDTSGTPFSTKTLDGTSNPSVVTSDPFTPNAAGRWCFAGEYSGDDNYPDGAIDSDESECFTVNPAQPEIVTNATDGPVLVGDPIDDVATLTGTANDPDGNPAGGTITFTAYGPHSDTTTCDTLVYTSVVTVSGDGDYTASSGTGGQFIPVEAGTYNWIAVYSGDPPNTLGDSTSCGDADESSVVAPRQPTIVTQVNDAGPVPLGSTLDDTATLSGTANDPDGSPADGTITFTAYGPHSDTTTCDTVAYTSVVNVSGDGDYTASSGTGGTFVPTVAGTYNWIAVYSGDPPNTLDASTACGDANESTVVITLQPTIATVQSVFPNDEATITVASGGGDLSGSVTFSLFDNATCTGTALFEETVDIPAMAGLTETVHTTNGDGVPATGLASDESVSVSGTYSWTSTFTSTNPAHENVTSPCHDEHFDVTFTNDDPGIP